MSRPRVYLAGPEVFLPDAERLGELKRAVCAAHGLDGVFPLDGEPLAAGPPEALAAAIFERCRAHIVSCDTVIANCTPFRGPSLDAGTAVELGFFLGLGRPVFGYTHVAGDYRDRVTPDGLAVEDFGLADNLMVEGAVRASGGAWIRSQAPPGSSWSWLVAFEACVERAARALGAAAS